LAEGERRHAEAQPFLDHRRVKQHGDGQRQADPETVAEEALVAGVVGVGFVFGAGGGLTQRVVMTRVAHHFGLTCGCAYSGMMGKGHVMSNCFSSARMGGGFHLRVRVASPLVGRLVTRVVVGLRGMMMLTGRLMVILILVH